jgi:hypothetical protein
MHERELPQWELMLAEVLQPGRACQMAFPGVAEPIRGAECIYGSRRLILEWRLGRLWPRCTRVTSECALMRPVLPKQTRRASLEIDRPTV